MLGALTWCCLVFVAMSLGVSELKKRLQDLGISTNTPGLVGDDRHEELQFRLDKVANTNENSKSTNALGFLSIAEIRSRLTEMGENTNTPGLVGDERKAELTRRLMFAICGSDNDQSNEMMDQIIAKEFVEEKESFNDMPAAVYQLLNPVQPVHRPPPPAVKAKLLDELEPIIVLPKLQAPEPEPEPLDEESELAPAPTALEISEMKKQVKRISNKRAMVVAARLSGPTQDICIYEKESFIGKIDSELARLRLQRLKPNASATQKISNIMVDNGSTMLTMDKMISQLELLKSDAKEQIRVMRAQIRESEDSHVEYGVTVEEALKLQLSEANLACSKGRVRRRVEEMRALGVDMQSRQQQGQETLHHQHQQQAGEGRSGGEQGYRRAVGPDHDDHNDNDDEDESVDGAVASPRLSNATEDKNKKVGGSGNKGKHDLMSKLRREEEMFEQMMMEETSDIQQISDHEPKPSVVPAVRQDEVVQVVSAPPAYVRPSPPKQPRVATPPNHAAGASLQRSVPTATNSFIVTKSALLSSSSDLPSALKSANKSTDRSNLSAALVSEEATQPAPPASKKYSSYLAAVAKTNSPPRSLKELYGDSDSNYDDDSSHQHDDSNDDDDDDEDDDSMTRKVQSVQKSSQKTVEAILTAMSASHSASASASASDTEAHSPVDTIANFACQPLKLQFENDETENEDIHGEQAQKQQFRNTPEAVAAQASGPIIASIVDKSKTNHVCNSVSNKENTGAEKQRKSLSFVDQPAVSSLSTAVLSDNNDDKKIASKPFHSNQNSVTSGHSSPKKQDRLRKQDSDSEGASDSSDEEDVDENNDDAVQIKSFRQHARVLESLGDLPATELMYARALELDPTDIRTLTTYAIFLHRRKGELARAEAFFLRALQTALPAVAAAVCATAHSPLAAAPPSLSKRSSPSSSSKAGVIVASPSHPPVPGNGGFVSPGCPQSYGDHTGCKIKHIIGLLHNFANFLSRAKGDLEPAEILHRKALEVAPSSGLVLASYAHFLAQDCNCANPGGVEKAQRLFEGALSAEPNNALYALWFAKLLRKQAGQIGKAELMYKVANANAQGNPKLEPMAICNYATFIYKQRKNLVLAQQLFKDGIDKFPKHKGLVKNYSTLLKANPDLGCVLELHRTVASKSSKRTFIIDENGNRIPSGLNPAATPPARLGLSSSLNVLETLQESAIDVQNAFKDEIDCETNRRSGVRVRDGIEHNNNNTITGNAWATTEGESFFNSEVNVDTESSKEQHSKKTSSSKTSSTKSSDRRIQGSDAAKIEKMDRKVAKSAAQSRHGQATAKDESKVLRKTVRKLTQNEEDKDDESLYSMS